MVRKKITAYQVFSVFNVIFMLFIILITAYPIYYIVVASFSDPGGLSRHMGLLWAPIKPYALSAYETVFRTPLIITGFRNTLFVLVVGLLVNLALTMLGAISTTNLIIMKSAFAAIPDSLIGSARLDGASYTQILIRVMVPLSKATIAVMVLYYGVGHWNEWFNASIYLRSGEKFPLQLVVRNILKLAGNSAMGTGAGMDAMAQLAELIKYALIVVTTTPILVLYPFLQKHFVKGVMVEAIKG